MKIRLAALRTRIHSALSSRVGRNALTFAVFVLIASVLWVVMALNEDRTIDVRATVRVVNVPDSLKLISYLPEDVSISVRATGNELLTFSVSRKAELLVDYKYYARNGHISLSSTEMRTLARRMLGQGSQIQAMTPDTLSLWYTGRRPVRLPVRVDASVTTLPNCALTRPVVSALDSVLVYSLHPLPPDFMAVPTAHLVLTDVAKSQNARVALVTPPGARAYPDSVMLGINVEPMISKRVQVPVRPLNVPSHLKMILIPAKVSVNYTVPMSRFDDTQPIFDAVADFNSLDGSFSSNRIKVELQRAEGNFLEVYLSADSIEYIIEQK